MSQVTGVVQGLLQVVLIGLGTALLFRILWSFFGVRLSLALRPVTRTIERRTQWLLGPLHQTILCVLAALFVCLVLAFPEHGPWAQIMSAGRSTTLSTQMLAGAAALLALLTFAASQAKTAEVAAQGGRTYLGHVMPTYRFLRSPWTRLTRQPAFQVLVVTLFAIPLVLTIVPASVSTSTTEIPVQGAPRLDDLLTALWCSAFALVGAILIMHLVSSIRTSLLETSQPDFVAKLVQWDLEDESALEWKELLTASTRRNGKPHALRDWAQHHATTTLALPPEERTLYALLTMSRAARSDTTQRLLGLSLRVFSRAFRAKPAHTATTPRNRLHAWWHSLTFWWRVDRRRARAQRLIVAFEDAHRTLVDTQGGLLTATDGEEDTFKERTTFARSITQSLFVSCGQIDIAHRKLRSHGANQLANTLVTPIRRLPDESLFYIPNELDDSRSPQVLTLPATVFRDIARAAYDPIRRGAHTVPTGHSLSELVTEVQRLDHQPTRIYALDEVLRCFIRGVVIKGSKRGMECYEKDSKKTEETQLEDPAALRKLWESRRPRPPSPGRSLMGGDELATLIEGNAFNLLAGNDGLTPTAKSHLLSVLTTWRPTCALLHELLYARRSHRSLSPGDLAPYASALRDMPPRDADELDELEKMTLHVIRDPAYNTSHFTHHAGITWLIRALAEPLTPVLCREFERQSNTFQIRELRLLDFVQWHFVAGGNLGALFYGDGFGGPAVVPEELRDSAAELWQFCKAWEDFNSYEASRLGQWLFETIGPDPRDKLTAS